MMDTVKRRRYVRWGIRSVSGTARGKWVKVGRRTVRVGTDMDRWDSLPFRSFCRSLVFSITAIVSRKLVHSRVMLTGPRMVIGRP